MPLSKEDNTLNTYNQIAKDWAFTRRANKNYWAEEHKKFKQMLPSGSILDIGCGPGRDSVWFIENGYGYLGIDASEAFIELAKHNNPEVKFEIKSFYEINKIEQKFNGFWACASLLHVPKERITGVLKDIKSHILPEGIGFISLKEGNGENSQIYENTNLTRFFAYYQQDEFRQILESAGFSLLEFDKQLSLRDSSTVWLTYFVKA